MAEPRIGTFLLKHLMRIARRNGIRGFTAEVLTENKPMQAVLNHSGLKVSSRLEEDVYSFDDGVRLALARVGGEA